MKSTDTEDINPDQFSDQEASRQKDFDPTSNNQGSVVPDMLGNDSNIGISFVARIYQPRTKQVMKLTCLASQSLVIKTISFYSHEASPSNAVVDLSSIPDPAASCYTVQFKALNKKLRKSFRRYIENDWHIGDDVTFKFFAAATIRNNSST